MFDSIESMLEVIEDALVNCADDVEQPYSYDDVDFRMIISNDVMPLLEDCIKLHMADGRKLDNDTLDMVCEYAVDVVKGLKESDVPDLDMPWTNEIALEIYYDNMANIDDIIRNNFIMSEFDRVMDVINAGIEGWLWNLKADVLADFKGCVQSAFQDYVTHITS